MCMTVHLPYTCIFINNMYACMYISIYIQKKSGCMYRNVRACLLNLINRMYEKSSRMPSPNLCTFIRMYSHLNTPWRSKLKKYAKYDPMVLTDFPPKTKDLPTIGIMMRFAFIAVIVIEGSYSTWGSKMGC